MGALVKVEACYGSFSQLSGRSDPPIGAIRVLIGSRNEERATHIADDEKIEVRAERR
jgi:hypothetical protein